MSRPPVIEALESRIAPAIVLTNPISDILVGAAQKTGFVELEQVVDPFVANAGHTLVKFTLNLDQDPNTAGLQLDTDPLTAGIQAPTVVIELYDDLAPLTVQNFLRYVQNPDTAADFLGTFFHRSVSGFVVQGGGYNASDVTHVNNFAPVHNEYSVERSNLRGTVAMAKVGSDPNSATSEWFFNLADNSANLDNQNGGFTVFGEVASGMNYVDQIAALATKNFGGAFTNLPLQNYTSGTPTKDNFITITGSQVVKPQAGTAPLGALTYELVGITDTTTMAASTAVKGTLTGSKLNLTYTGLSGVADVTVKITDPTDPTHPVTDTFRVTAMPNLITSIKTDSLTSIIIPGDSGTVNLTVSNTGGATYTGAIDLNVYLPKADASQNVPSADDIIGAATGKSVTIASGSSLTIAVPVKIAMELTTGTEAYHLLAAVAGAGTTPQQELFTDDQLALNGGYHALTSEFGNIPSRTISVQLADGSSQNTSFSGRAGAKLTYTTPDGKPATFSITGAGAGKITTVGDDLNLDVTGTDAASILNFTTTGRDTFHNLNVPNRIATMNLAQADFDGYLTLSSGAKTATFGNLTAGNQTMIIGTFDVLNSQKVALKFGSVTDLSIESDQNIASLTALQWLDPTGRRDVITTPSIGTINITGQVATAIRGDFEADVNVLNPVTVSAITVKGYLKDSTITTAGNIASVSLGGMLDSNLFAGTKARPTKLADFTAARTISKFAINGVSGDTVFFSNSQVAASTIATIVVRGIDTTDIDHDFGFVADKVTSYTRVGQPAKLNLSAPASIDRIGDYLLTIL